MSKYIDADKAIKDYARYGIKHFYDATDLEAILNECPAADVQEIRRGRWKCVSIGRYACSLCGREPWYEGSINTMHYCPNCGSKMDEVTE